MGYPVQGIPSFSGAGTGTPGNDKDFYSFHEGVRVKNFRKPLSGMYQRFQPDPSTRVRTSMTRRRRPMKRTSVLARWKKFALQLSSDPLTGSQAEFIVGKWPEIHAVCGIGQCVLKKVGPGSDKRQEKGIGEPYADRVEEKRHDHVKNNHGCGRVDSAVHIRQISIGNMDRETVRTRETPARCRVNYQISGRRICSDGNFRYSGNRFLFRSENLGGRVLWYRSACRFFHGPLGDLLQRAGLVVDWCRTGRCPDSRMVYVPGDYPDKIRLTGNHTFSAIQMVINKKSFSLNSPIQYW